jgi:hypothetical protein
LQTGSIETLFKNHTEKPADENEKRNNEGKEKIFFNRYLKPRETTNFIKTPMPRNDGLEFNEVLEIDNSSFVSKLFDFLTMDIQRNFIIQLFNNTLIKEDFQEFVFKEYRLMCFLVEMNSDRSQKADLIGSLSALRKMIFEVLVSDDIECNDNKKEILRFFDRNIRNKNYKDLWELSKVLPAFKIEMPGKKKNG